MTFARTVWGIGSLEYKMGFSQDASYLPLELQMLSFWTLGIFLSLSLMDNPSLIDSAIFV